MKLTSNKVFNKYKVDRRLPKNYIINELDFCKKEFSYETLDVYLKEYKFCSVNYEGNTYNNFTFLEVDSLVHPDFYETSRGIIKPLRQLIIKKKKILFDNKTYLLAYDMWSGNHYHWLCDFLPKLWLVKDDLDNYTLILPDNNYVRSIGLEMLKLLELVPNDIIFIKHNELFMVKNLKLITQSCITGKINDKLMFEISNRLRAKLNKVENTGNNNIYITRDKAKYRKVLNEKEVVKMLKSRNFEVVDLGEISLIDQLELVNNSKLLVSIHGAGLTNMIAMPENASVIEFRRNGIYENQCYWHLADSVNLQYHYYFGKPDQDKVIEGAGCNLTIDLNTLEKVLDKANA